MKTPLDQGRGRYVVLTQDSPLLPKRIAYQGDLRDAAVGITNRLDLRQNAWLFDLQEITLADKAEFLFISAQKNHQQRVSNMKIPSTLEAELTLTRLAGSLRV